MTHAQAPALPHYDVIIVGGAMFGASVAWFLADNPDFDGTVLVVEMDPSYASSSTAHTNSCMRQQFSRKINVQVSQFAADFVNNFHVYMGNDPRVPRLSIQNYGYMYLADNDAFANVLRDSQRVQAQCGAGHYAYNTFDHNAILGPHDRVRNFLFLNGFSGHGLQQSPAMGRGVAEFIAYEEYRTLDLSPFAYDRIPKQQPFIEQAII